MAAGELFGGPDINKPSIQLKIQMIFHTLKKYWRKRVGVEPTGDRET
jgi:hypothetical protein